MQRYQYQLVYLCRGLYIYERFIRSTSSIRVLILFNFRFIPVWRLFEDLPGLFFILEAQETRMQSAQEFSVCILQKVFQAEVRHQEAREELTQWKSGRVRRDISDVRFAKKIVRNVRWTLSDWLNYFLRFLEMSFNTSWLDHYWCYLNSRLCFMTQSTFKAVHPWVWQLLTISKFTSSKRYLRFSNWV